MNSGGPVLITAPQLTQLRAGKVHFGSQFQSPSWWGRLETGSRTRKMDDHMSSAYMRRRMGETGKEGEVQVETGWGLVGR